MIEFKNLKKSFGSKKVLQGISFSVAEGEILFILGVSGTGKSVLLKNLVGLLRPDEGEIWMDGQNITHFTEEEYGSVRKKCGMVFQNPALFDSMTIFENVAFGLKKHYNFSEGELKEKVLQNLELVHLQGIEQKLPQELSFGMQKRASLARTIAIRPKILLFDEPTTGLDPITTNAINKLILDLSKELKTTSIVVSHDMHCALDIADRIIVLDKGKIIEEGTPEHLRSSQVPLVKDFLYEVNELA